MAWQITGHTRIIAHIGVPTATFRSPMIYNPWFEATATDVVVVPMGCEAGDFPSFLPLVARLRNFAGALVTMPHKVVAAGLVDLPSEAVRVCGACNAVRRDAEGRLVGDMFDGEGFRRGMERKGHRAEGAAALIVGAGGVGSAIAAALAGAGAMRIGLCDTEVGRAEALATRIDAAWPGRAVVAGHPDPEGWDIVVNATPLGMRPDDPLPFDPARLTPGAVVGDVVLADAETPFLTAAHARGCATVSGTDMLFEQIPAYLEFFCLPVAKAEDLRRLARLSGPAHARVAPGSGFPDR